jgi:glutamine kinase
MTMSNAREKRLDFGTKAETLARLRDALQLAEVPRLIFFTTDRWRSQASSVLNEIKNEFEGQIVAVRSSAIGEDGHNSSMAGEFQSVLNVCVDDSTCVINAINMVVTSFEKKFQKENKKNQIIVQKMIKNDVLMSGVLFTLEMKTGAPYYVINYDDQTGKTDSVTGGGIHSNRTLYVLRDSQEAVRSKRFSRLLKAVTEIETLVLDTALDIEFAVTADYTVHILQVRPITTRSDWSPYIIGQINQAVIKVEKYLSDNLGPDSGIYGDSTVFGQMPDWNPAEIIGRAPRPLAFSLYRYLISDRVWAAARAQMGYKDLTGYPLIVSLGGQPYVDVRLSFNSFLPHQVPATIASKLVEGWITRLSEHPELHDKIEFEIATTCFSLDFDHKVVQQFPEALTANELSVYKDCLKDFTRALLNGAIDSVTHELEKVEQFRRRQMTRSWEKGHSDWKHAGELLEECLELGTMPFAILARHAFISQTLLKSLVFHQVLDEHEILAFMNSITTVAGNFIHDSHRVRQGSLTKKEFFRVYGHLRPGTYDILSSRYDQRGDVVDFGGSHSESVEPNQFFLTSTKAKAVDRLLKENDFELDHQSLFLYAEMAIKAREYSKFVFTRNLSDSLEVIADWAEQMNISRAEVSFIDLDLVLQGLNCKKEEVDRDFYLMAIQENQQLYKTTQALRLPELIVDVSGARVIPFQLSVPNFVTTKSITGDLLCLDGMSRGSQDLGNRIILIESADPGFDWIFSYKIAGLVTKYGGVNSHMAIRCAEFGVPAAIGCGEQIFDRLLGSKTIQINCAEGLILPV